LNDGAIVGIVIGGLAVLCAVAVGVKMVMGKLSNGSSSSSSSGARGSMDKSPMHDGGFYQPPNEADTKGSQHDDDA
jgi:hypothetical protein